MQRLREIIERRDQGSPEGEMDGDVRWIFRANVYKLEYSVEGLVWVLESVVDQGER